MCGAFPISVQSWSAETAKPSLFAEEHEPAEGPVAQPAVAIWQQPVCTEDKSLLLAAWKVWFGFWKMQFKWTICRVSLRYQHWCSHIHFMSPRERGYLFPASLTAAYQEGYFNSEKASKDLATLT